MYSLDMQSLALEAGYWSAYYNNKKHPKSVASIQKSMRRSMDKKSGHCQEAPDVDTYLALEKKRLQMMTGREA